MPARPRGSGGPVAMTAVATEPQIDLSRYPTFQSVVALIEETRDIKLLVEVKHEVRLVSYAPGRIEFQPTDRAPNDLATRLGRALKLATGARWAISVTAEGGGATIAEEEEADKNRLKAEIAQHPMMQAVLAAFPQAQIADIRTHDAIAAQAEVEALEALPEDDDDWDPFEDD